MENDTIRKLVFGLTTAPEGAIGYRDIGHTFRLVSKAFGDLLQEGGDPEDSFILMVNPCSFFQNLTDKEFELLPEQTLIDIINTAHFIDENITPSEDRPPDDLSPVTRVSISFTNLYEYVFSHAYLSEEDDKLDAISEKRVNLGNAIVMLGKCFADAITFAEENEWGSLDGRKKYYKDKVLKSLDQYQSSRSNQEV